MKKMLFLLQAVMTLAACEQNGDQGTAYVRITAEEALVELGYTNIKELGGSMDWPYETQ